MRSKRPTPREKFKEKHPLKSQTLESQTLESQTLESQTLESQTLEDLPPEPLRTETLRSKPLRGEPLRGEPKQDPTGDATARVADSPPTEDEPPLPDDPIARAQVLAGRTVIEKARLRIAKHRTKFYRDIREGDGRPHGEQRSEVIVRDVELVPLERIIDDPEFTNLRLPPTEEEAEHLEGSMQSEGLKVPVELIPSLDRRCYHVRCGFRRVAAAKRLKWENIPAIVLPHDTPKADEYWTNIIENSARDRLTTYEIASAAKIMREKFGVKAREFASRAGYSETYVVQLLRCIDKLPPEIIEIWKERAPIPIRLYDQWTSLTKEEAIAAMQVYRGRNPTIVGNWSPPPNMRKKTPLRMLTSRGLARIQRMRFAVEVARALSERERTLCLEVVDFCTGARDDVGFGVLKNGQKLRIYQSRRKQDQEEEMAPEDLLGEAWFSKKLREPGGMDEMGKMFEHIRKLQEQYEEMRKKGGK